MPVASVLVVLLVLAAPAAAARRESITASRFDLDPGEWRYFEFPAKEEGARLEVQFDVLSPENAPGVRVRIFADSQFQRFRNNQPHQELSSTPYKAEGRWRTKLVEPGSYVVVIDNRREGSRKSRVWMEATLTTGREPEELPVTYASPRKRRVVVAASLAGFLAIVGVAGEALWRAVKRRPPPSPPPSLPIWS